MTQRKQDHTAGEEIDPITLEVIWKRFQGIAEEMGTHFKSTAFSEVIKNGNDLATGLCTADGELVAQGVYTPGLLGPMPYAMRNILENHFGPDDWNPGDIVVTNNPYIGTGHLPDILMFEPVFYDSDLVGFSVIVGHHIDVGGSAPGSFSMRAIDLYAEGLQIPPVKLYERGELNEPLFETVFANSRVPEKVRGDLRAQRGATDIGVDLYHNLVDEFGLETVSRYVREIFDRCERSVQDALREVPDGTYRFEDRIGGLGDKFPIQVALVVDGGELTVDFTGTARQQYEYSINCPLNYTASYVQMAIKSAIDPDTPQSHGTVKPLTIEAPEGSIVNPTPPAPVASRHVLADRIVGCVNGAFHEAIPGRVPANGTQMLSVTMKSMDKETGRQNVMLDMCYGGAGGRPDRDGVPSISGSSNASNIPIESFEVSTPVRFDQYQFVEDTAGAGEHRGGPGTVREITFLADTQLQLITDRFEQGPYGLEGGEDGAPGAAIVNPGTDGERSVNSKDEVFVDSDGVVRFYIAGGGGYGDPHNRDESAVRTDVENGIVSADAAREVYGADID